MIFFEDFSSDEEDVQNKVLNKVARRKIRDQSNPLELPNDEFSSNFRINKECLKMMLDSVKLRIGLREDGIPPILQLCATLQVLASGSYQVNVGFNRLIGMAQTTVSKVFRNTLECLENQFCPQWIKFEEQAFDECRSHFYEKFKLPGVIGCVDGTHIPLLKPNVNEHIFFNRKGFHSLNAMIVCNHKNKILVVDCSNGGASHDSFAWNKSDINNFLQRKDEEGNCNVRLLGDSGYPHLPWLLTPYKRISEGSAEMHFNSVHSTARSIVERTIGILKGRWRCLCSDRKLRFSPEQVAKIVNVCAALHNVCIFYNITQDFNVRSVIEREHIIQGTSDTCSDNAQNRAIIIRNRIRDSLL